MMKAAPLTKIAELYGLPTFQPAVWKAVAAAQQCPFLNRKCLKNRKSEPEITIGTCTMIHGRQPQPVMICPFRLLERSQIFTDCIHLLKLHEPENELRIVAELAVPGGSIDYCLVSVRDGKPRDFVGIELQTMLDQIEAKLPQSTLLMVGGGPVPVPEITDIKADES